MISSRLSGISEISDGTDCKIYSTTSLFSKYGQLAIQSLIPATFGELVVQIAIFIIFLVK